MRGKRQAVEVRIIQGLSCFRWTVITSTMIENYSPTPLKMKVIYFIFFQYIYYLKFDISKKIFSIFYKKSIVSKKKRKKEEVRDTT